MNKWKFMPPCLSYRSSYFDSCNCKLKSHCPLAIDVLIEQKKNFSVVQKEKIMLVERKIERLGYFFQNAQSDKSADTFAPMLSGKSKSKCFFLKSSVHRYDFCFIQRL